MYSLCPRQHGEWLARTSACKRHKHLTRAAARPGTSHKLMESVCSQFTNVGARQESPGSNTKDLIAPCTASNVEQENLSPLVAWPSRLMGGRHPKPKCYSLPQWQVLQGRNRERGNPLLLWMKQACALPWRETLPPYFQAAQCKQDPEKWPR